MKKKKSRFEPPQATRRSLLRCRGVSRVKRKSGDRFIARLGVIGADGKLRSVYLGTFDTILEAKLAYAKAFSEKFGFFPK